MSTNLLPGKTVTRPQILAKKKWKRNEMEVEKFNDDIVSFIVNFSLFSPS